MDSRVSGHFNTKQLRRSSIIRSITVPIDQLLKEPYTYFPLIRERKFQAPKQQRSHSIPLRWVFLSASIKSLRSMSICSHISQHSQRSARQPQCQALRQPKQKNQASGVYLKKLSDASRVVGGLATRNPAFVVPLKTVCSFCDRCCQK